MTQTAVRRPAPQTSRLRRSRSIRRRRLTLAAVIVFTAVGVVHLVAPSTGTRVESLSPLGGPSPATEPTGARPPSHASPAFAGWPSQGQAAYEVGGTAHASPGQDPAPIASLAKLMTALLVTKNPIRGLTVSQRDVDDTEERRHRGDSVITLAVGEHLTQTEALEGLLLPSANNIAAMLATAVSGSEADFVDAMNTEAHALGMTRTTYTDPSGFDSGTVSTAADQLRLVEAVLQRPVLAQIVSMPTAVLPVVGTVRNTDTLVGTDGWVGVKTGSTDAAGGCFAFRVLRGQRQITGVVLGQRGGPLIQAGLRGAQDLVSHV